MCLRLTPLTLDDLELLYVRIFSVIRGISQILEATTVKRMNIDCIVSDSVVSYPLNVLFNVMFLELICRRFLH